MSQWWLKKTTTGEACGDLGRMVGHILQLDPEGYTSSEASDLTCSDSDSGSYVSEGETPSSHDLARSLSQLQGRPGAPKTSAEVQLLQQILKMLDKSGVDTDSHEEENIFKKCVIDYASREKVTFADIVGCHEAKASLKMDFISHAEDKDWKRCSPSYCFYGPPGTGKTSLFKALMSALGADFTYCYLSAARLNDKYHGVSEKRLQSIFDHYFTLVDGQLEYLKETGDVLLHRGSVSDIGKKDAVVVNSRYNTHASDKLQRKVTQFFNLPPSLKHVEGRILVEYKGELPKKGIPHGNCKDPDGPAYVRTNPKVMEEAKERCRTKAPAQVYMEMTLEGSDIRSRDVTRYARSQVTEPSEKRENFADQMKEALIETRREGTFVQELVVQQGQPPAFVIYGKCQLRQVKLFCTSAKGEKCSVLGVDKVYNLGPYFITSTVFSNPYLCRRGNSSKKP